MKGKQSTSQTTIATTTFSAECSSEAQGTQGSEHQDEEEAHADPPNADLERGASIDPQDDPQDGDIERGAIVNPKFLT